jgi:DNA-binding NtrC family response regulator
MIESRYMKSERREAADDVAETVTTTGADSRTGTARVLHVTGPNGAARRLLPQGLVALGRDATSTIVLDDPRVSRAHAALHVADAITITDLGSANGTFVERRRLAPHQPTELPLSASFTVGDSTLVVSASAFRRRSEQRVADWAEVEGRQRARAAAGGSARVALVRVHALGRGGADDAEAILGELLLSPRDWLLRGAANEVWLGFEAVGAADGPSTRRDILRLLASWGCGADVEVAILEGEAITKPAAELRALLDAPPPVALGRGAAVFKAPPMVALKRTLIRVAPVSVNVLVLGETGAGKDVVASLLHELSPRAEKRFVAINCASFPESLIESELFGHERGAFTGAASSKPGLLESADGGTVFLDEIGELPASMQAKLLRVIESHEVTRLGGLVPRRIDVRFVAATNSDLEAEVAAGQFRRDLFFRLNTVTVTVPPLRERPSEIEPLARLFLENARRRFNLPALGLSASALEALEAHLWPGNVRELRNLIERAALLATSDVIEPAHLSLPEPKPERPRTTVAVAPIEGARPREDGAESERARIERALSESAGNQSRAAEALGIPRRTLVRLIARLGIPRPRD